MYIFYGNYFVYLCVYIVMCNYLFVFMCIYSNGVIIYAYF